MLVDLLSRPLVRFSLACGLGLGLLVLVLAQALTG